MRESVEKIIEEVRPTLQADGGDVKKVQKPKSKSQNDNVRFRDEVKQVISEVRPNLQADGGDVELVKATGDGIVEVRLQGACHGCPMAAMTLQFGIERLLKEKVDGFKKLVAVD